MEIVIVVEISQLLVFVVVIVIIGPILAVTVIKPVVMLVVIITKYGVFYLSGNTVRYYSSRSKSGGDTQSDTSNKSGNKNDIRINNCNDSN